MCADTKISALPELTTPSDDDVFPIVDAPGGAAATKKVTWVNVVATIIATTLATLTVTALIVPTSLRLSSQPSGRIPYTESNGYVTTTPNLTYNSSTREITTTGIVLTHSTTTNATTTSSYTSGLANFAKAYATLFDINSNITVNGVVASSTFYMSGASGLIGTLSAATSPTSTSLLINGIPSQVYAFNATTTQCMYWVPFVLRGAWDVALLKPTITWTSATGTGNVVWRLRARSETDDTYIGTVFTNAIASYATSSLGQGYYQQREAMDNLTVQNAGAGIGIRFELCRLATSNGDTLGQDAYVILVDGKYGIGKYSD